MLSHSLSKLNCKQTHFLSVIGELVVNSVGSAELVSLQLSWQVQRDIFSNKKQRHWMRFHLLK